MNLEPGPLWYHRSELNYSVFMVFSFLTLFVLFANADIQPILIKGSHFFYRNGSQFVVRGVSYADYGRQGYHPLNINDLLSQEDACSRDIKYLKRLGINLLEVDLANPDLEHTKCMELLANNEIYVMLNMMGRSHAYMRNGTLSDHYEALESFESMIDRFKEYPNLLGFYLTVNWRHTQQMPAAKLWVRHIKEYIRKKSNRTIPVGLNVFHQPNNSLISQIPEYLNCGDTKESIDFLGQGFSQALVPCVDSSVLLQNRVIERLANYSIPVLLHYGCATTRGHNFTEVQMIYGENSSKILAGGVTIEWLEDYSAPDMGLVDIVKVENISVRPNYIALSAQLGSVHPSTALMDNYVPTNTAPSLCSRLNWNIKTTNVVDKSHTTLIGEITTDLPHTPSARLCACMMETLQCISNQADVHNDSIWREHCENSFDNVLCTGITNNYTSGVYGTYAGCSVRERQSWILNQLLVSELEDPAACTSIGGVTKSYVPSNSRQPDCDAFLRQAGTAATGKITFTATDLPLNTTTMGHALKPAARAGIAVGIIICILLLAAVTFGVYTLLKRRRAVQTENEMGFVKPELPDNSKSPIHELEANLVQEIDGESRSGNDSATRHHEVMTGSNEAVELDGRPSIVNSKV